MSDSQSPAKATRSQAKVNGGDSVKELETTHVTGEKREVDATESSEDTEAKAPPAKKQKPDYTRASKVLSSAATSTYFIAPKCSMRRHTIWTT